MKKKILLILLTLCAGSVPAQALTEQPMHADDMAQIEEFKRLYGSNLNGLDGISPAEMQSLTQELFGFEEPERGPSILDLGPLPPHRPDFAPSGGKSSAAMLAGALIAGLGTQAATVGLQNYFNVSKNRFARETDDYGNSTEGYMANGVVTASSLAFLGTMGRLASQKIKTLKKKHYELEKQNDVKNIPELSKIRKKIRSLTLIQEALVAGGFTAGVRGIVGLSNTYTSNEQNKKNKDQAK